MIFATTAGDDRAAEALRRLGVMRVATKYPRIARRHSDRTGRQAEIVEVKGSVELAPLTGLVEGIVDLTATGTTLRENGLVVREEILASTARLIANPVAHKLRAAEIDDVVARVREALEMHRLRIDAAGAAAAAARVRAMVPAGGSVAGAVAEIVAAVAEGGDAALLDHERRFGGGAEPLRVAADELAAALDGLDAGVRAGLEVAWPMSGALPRRASPPTSTSRLPRASTCGCASCPCGAPPSTRPGGRDAVSRPPS